MLTNYNQQTQSYKFTSHTAAFLSVVLITEMLEFGIQTSYDQHVQLIFKELSPLSCCSGYYPKSTKEFFNLQGLFMVLSKILLIMVHGKNTLL